MDIRKSKMVRGINSIYKIINAIKNYLIGSIVPPQDS